MGAANDITRKHCLLHECRIASMPRRPPSPHVLLTRRPRRRERLPCATLRSCRMPFHIPRLARASLHACGVRRCGPHCWVAPQCPKMHAPRSTFANRSSDSPPETSRFVAARRRPTSCSPATRGAARGRPARRCELAARHATSRSSRASPSGLAACDDGARTVAPRRNVYRCRRRVPKSKAHVSDSPPATPCCRVVHARPALRSPMGRGATRCAACDIVTLLRGAPHCAHCGCLCFRSCSAARTVAPRLDA